MLFVLRHGPVGLGVGRGQQPVVGGLTRPRETLAFLSPTRASPADRLGLKLSRITLGVTNKSDPLGPRASLGPASTIAARWALVKRESQRLCSADTQEIQGSAANILPAAWSPGPWVFTFPTFMNATLGILETQVA